MMQQKFHRHGVPIHHGDWPTRIQKADRKRPFQPRGHEAKTDKVQHRPNRHRVAGGCLGGSQCNATAPRRGYVICDLSACSLAPMIPIARSCWIRQLRRRGS